MENLHHPNIIRLYEVIETLAKLHIVMEYAGGGELFNKLSNEGKFSEPEAKIIFSQIVAAVDHMHCQNIIHRDMKAENVFYAGPRLVKIGDFGFSISTRRDNPLNTFCGSPPYAAPELFKDESYIGIYVDVWALGILLFFMVTGIMPFRADTVAKLKKCILEGNYTIPSYVSDSCQFLIRSILKPMPQDRFGINEIKASEWLEGQEFPEALEPYNVNPSPVGADLSEEERLARKTLSDLGITEDHIRNVRDQNSHSNITGTYRIVLHKVQKRRLGITDAPMIERALTDVNRNQSKPKNSTGSKQSKFCVIL
ncbi:hypothetical protein ACJMK2_041630 [Sinanodonta woodiana]|uniref:Protein kinase domain-containing protein n=1 Tax=Sinanodonta woodiana TaxID=1069815 RepID=A0ABD3W4V5_SINWO